MTGVSQNTLGKLLLELGSACTRYQDAAPRRRSSFGPHSSSWAA